MSANLIVDLNGVAQLAQSFPAAQSQYSPSGQVCGLSGIQIGQSIYLGNADTACQLVAMGQCVVNSGPLLLQVQCSDTDTSGTYTDPTSGLAQLPSAFLSGGILQIGQSGQGIYNLFTSGQAVQSGFNCAAYFQRTGLYARVNMLSGLYVGNLQAGFISMNRTTGSGGGFTYQPGSGTVNV